MSGHVHKRGTTWTVVYDEGHDENGRRRQRSKGGFATRREAQRFLTDMLSRLGDGSYAQPSQADASASSSTASGCPRSRAPCGRSRSRSTARVVRLRIVPHARPRAPAGALRRPSERPLPRARARGPVRVDAAADPRRAAPRATRRGPLGQAGPQPRRHGRPAAQRRRSRAQAWTASELRPLPRPRRRRPAVSRSGGWRRRPGCAAASSPGSPGAASTSTAPGCRSSSSSSPPAAAPASARRSRRARGARSRSTPRPSTRSREHREAQLLERDFAGDAYVDQDLVFCRRARRLDPPAAADRVVRRSTARLPGSRPGPCTSCATPRRRWR